MMDIRIPRTLAQVPVRHVARFAPMDRQQPARPPADDGMFPIARQLVEVDTDRERAALLLRLPDEIVVLKGKHLKDACAASGFTMGVAFLEIRTGSLTARRDREGRLPEHCQRALEHCRGALVAIANGAKA